MSHHEDSGSGDERHDHGAERHHHHHQRAHGHGHERQQGGPRLEAHASGSPQEIAGYLDDLANAIRAGGITMRYGERAVGLRLNGEVTLNLHAAAGDGGTSHLGLSLSWQAPQPPKPPAPPAPKLRISPLQAPEPGGGPQPGEPGAPSEGGSEPYAGAPPESMPEGQAFGG